MHIASPQDVLHATLVAVSAVLASREEYMHWLHEVCTEGVRLAWEVTLGLVVGLERPRARYACLLNLAGHDQCYARSDRKRPCIRES